MSISVTQCKNWILQDPLLDYLNIFGDDDKKDSFAYKECNFSSYIMSKGIDYEKQVVEHIIQLINGRFSHTMIERTSFYNDTKTAFKNKTDVIFQPFIKDYNGYLFDDGHQTMSHGYQTFGFPDIIIKKKVLQVLFNFSVEIVGKPDDYICIDIKYSKCANKNGLLHIDTNYTKFVSCQVMLYGLITNILFKQKVSHGFVLPKQSLENNLQLLGVCLNNKEHLELCNTAFSWISFISESGKEFNLDDCLPCMKELLPNLNNTMDYPWNSYKVKLAKQYKELSLISGIGNKLRTKLHNNNQFTINDIDIKDFQKTCLKSLISITNNNNNNNVINSKRRIYIDIETCYLFSLSREIIVMICCGYYDANNKWICNIFSNDRDGSVISDDSFLVNQFLQYVKTTPEEIVFVHFSPAENKVFKKIKETEPLLYFDTEDLHQSFLSKYKTIEKLDINNLSGFGIKEIMKALHSNNTIDKNPYDNCLIKSGIEVLAFYNQWFENFYDTEFQIKAKIIVEDIKKYNEADIIALYLIDKVLN